MQPGTQEQQRQAERIEALIQKVAMFSDPQVRKTTEELLQALLDMYGEGLARLLEMTAATGSSGLALIDTFAGDDLLGSLFALHGLHPLAIETRVEQALEQVRPSLKMQGVSVELLRVEEGTAHLRLQGNCHSCGSSTATLQSALEEVLYQAVPDLNGLEVEGESDPPQRAAIPMTFVPPRRRQASLPG